MSRFKREMTWEERVQWVMKNVQWVKDVESENLYLTEEINKETTPTHIVFLQVGEEIVTSYERCEIDKP
jgi:hypothetical protein